MLALLTRTRLLMRIRIDIDPKHSRAIVQEIGERLRAFLKEEPELGALERKSIGSTNWKGSRHQSFPVLSAGTNFTVEPPRTAQTARPNMDAQCHRRSAVPQIF
jgi:hypothetical protein